MLGEHAVASVLPGWSMTDAVIAAVNVCKVNMLLSIFFVGGP